MYKTMTINELEKVATTKGIDVKALKAKYTHEGIYRMRLTMAVKKVDGIATAKKSTAPKMSFVAKWNVPEYMREQRPSYIPVFQWNPHGYKSFKVTATRIDRKGNESEKTLPYLASYANIESAVERLLKEMKLNPLDKEQSDYLLSHMRKDTYWTHGVTTFRGTFGTLSIEIEEYQVAC